MAVIQVFSEALSPTPTGAGLLQTNFLPAYSRTHSALVKRLCVKVNEIGVFAHKWSPPICQAFSLYAPAPGVFSPNNARRCTLPCLPDRSKLGKIPRYPSVPELYVNNRFASLINAVRLEYGFSPIDTNCSNLHLGRLSAFVGTHIRHFGTRMPL